MRAKMNPDLLNVLLVAGYFLGGTLAIAMLSGWALRDFNFKRQVRNKTPTIRGG
jgi:hypothetical protein